MKEAYETDYGLEDHERHDASPLSTVLFRDSEHYLESIHHGKLIREYRKKKINEYFGESFSEYIAHPPYICEMMVKEIDRFEREVDKIKEGVKNGI